MYRLVVLVTGILCLLIATDAALGQAATTGAIQGTISDPSGAAVPGAEITATNVAMGRSWASVSGDTGFYSVGALPAGIYNVTVQLAGFKTYRGEGVKLEPGERRGLNVALEVGEVTTELVVQATTLAVKTESGEISDLITEDQIDEIPLNGRNFVQLLALTPGVNLGTGGASEMLGGGLTQGTVVVVNGLGNQMSNYQLDGTFNMNTGCMCQMNITSPLDTISEVRILKDNYSARVGISGGANVMVETKSGTQEFHGSVYEFARNDVFDASNFFAGIDPVTKEKRKTPLNQHNFGFTIGGPVIIPGKYNTEKDKTFFFVGEEWRRRRSGLTLRGALPTTEMRAGDFSQSPTLPKPTDTDPGGLRLSDSAQDRLSRLHPGEQCVIGSDKLNPGCFDPNAVALMQTFWPLPNNIVPGQFLNYINPGKLKDDQRSDTYRVDHYFSDDLSVMYRFAYEDVVNVPPALTWGGNVAPPLAQRIRTTGMNNVLRFTSNISPTTINQVTLAETHDKPRLLGFNAEEPSGLSIRRVFPGADPHRHIPQIGIGKGWSPISSDNLPVRASDGEVSFGDDLSLVRGNHVIQIGGVYIWGVKRQNLFSQAEGNFFFSGIQTGDPMADFMLGLNASYFQTDGERYGNFFYNQYEIYLQDDWKVMPRLTLNLGVRYQYFSPDWIGSSATEEVDKYTNFSPELWNPLVAPEVLPNGTFVLNDKRQPLTPDGQVAQIFNGLTCPGTERVFGDPSYFCPEVPRGVYPPWRLGFGPRLGFAWDVFGDGTTSIRGGYGLGYTRVPFAQYVSMNNPPFISSITLLNGTLTDPSFGAEQAPKGPPGLNWLHPQVGGQPTAVHTWSLVVQREMWREAVLDVGYIGSAGRKLKATKDINFPIPMAGPSIENPDCLRPGQTIPPGGFDFDPCLNRNLVSANFTRPFRGWGGFSTGHGGGGLLGESNYHSLQVGFDMKTLRQLNLTLAYTWSKSLTNVSSAAGGALGQVGGGAQNPRNFDLDYGLASFDRPHMFTAGYIWRIPVMQGRSDWAGQVLGNWTLSGTTYFLTGFPFTPGLATGTNGLATRPNRVGDPEGPQTVEKWFDTTAFVAPAFGFFGEAGKGIIRGPGEQTWHMALFKDFGLGWTEDAQLQFRAEFFNIFNRANFSGLSTALGAGTYGQIVSALLPRQIQFGLRIDF